MFIFTHCKFGIFYLPIINKTIKKRQSTSVIRVSSTCACFDPISKQNFAWCGVRCTTFCCFLLSSADKFTNRPTYICVKSRSSNAILLNLNGSSVPLFQAAANQEVAARRRWVMNGWNLAKRMEMSCLVSRPFIRTIFFLPWPLTTSLPCSQVLDFYLTVRLSNLRTAFSLRDNNLLF